MNKHPLVIKYVSDCLKPIKKYKKLIIVTFDEDMERIQEFIFEELNNKQKSMNFNEMEVVIIITIAILWFISIKNTAN